jgi:hypothetical protein
MNVVTRNALVIRAALVLAVLLLMVVTGMDPVAAGCESKGCLEP